MQTPHIPNLGVIANPTTTLVTAPTKLTPIIFWVFLYVEYIVPNNEDTQLKMAANIIIGKNILASKKSFLRVNFANRGVKHTIIDPKVQYKQIKRFVISV